MSVYYAGGITVSIIAFVFTIKFLCELAARVVSFLQNEDRGRRGDHTIYDYVRGNYLDPRSCKVTWDWKDPQEVGHTMTFRVYVCHLIYYEKEQHIMQQYLYSNDWFKNMYFNNLFLKDFVVRLMFLEGFSLIMFILVVFSLLFLFLFSTAVL